MKKKFRSKFTRIAVEGATTDGRKIERQWIEEMAEQYSLETYGARLNCEHIKWFWPGGEFGAYGTVTALKAEEVELAGEKRLALYAQIEPNDALLAVNAAGQKIYTSIEVQPKFADTGKAYLVGLAITDSPASLGTEALSFSAEHGTLASRKADKENLFSAAEEVEFVFDEITDTAPKAAGLFKRVTEMLTRSKEREVVDEARFADVTAAIEAIATHATEQLEAVHAVTGEIETLAAAHEKLAGDFADLIKRLGETEDHRQQQRPPASGGTGQMLATY